MGVPFFTWRYSHAKHHAGTSHMTREQAYVPPTRSELGLPPFSPAKEDRIGSRVSSEVQRELWDAIGDSPIGAMFTSFAYLVSRAVMSEHYQFIIFPDLSDHRLACIYCHEYGRTAELSEGHEPYVCCYLLVCLAADREVSGQTLTPRRSCSNPGSER